MRDVDKTLGAFAPDSLMEGRIIQGTETSGLEAILHVVEHFSMHTGQIVLLTKILAKKDLAFYDFSTGKPIPYVAAVPSE